MMNINEVKALSDALDAAENRLEEVVAGGLPFFIRGLVVLYYDVKVERLIKKLRAARETTS